MNFIINQELTFTRKFALYKSTVLPTPAFFSGNEKQIFVDYVES